MFHEIESGFGLVRSACGCGGCSAEDSNATLAARLSPDGPAGADEEMSMTGGSAAASAGPVMPQFLTGSEATGTLAIDALAVGGGSRWNAGSTMGTPVDVTFSFMDNRPEYAADVVNFHPFNETQKAMARLALEEFADACGLSFTEVSDAGSGGQIRFGTDAQGFSAGYAYYPEGASAWGGDVWLANDWAPNFTPAPGTDGYATLLHEIGHAVGLKHPGNYNAGGGGTEGPYLPAAEDWTRFTVMSYNVDGNFPEDLGPYDFAALRHLYGERSYMMGTQGDDMLVGDDPSGSAIRGDYGADTISGSVGGDVIYGNHNSDLIVGEAGDDTLYGGQNDGLPRQDAYGEWRMQDGVETIEGGAGNDAVYGNYGNETIDGGAGDDTLYGGQNDDTIQGGAGNDVIFGNRDNDLLFGGAGDDVFYFAGNGGNDTIGDVELGYDAPFDQDIIVIATDINGTGIVTGQDVLDRMADNAAGQAVVDLGDGNSLTFANASKEIFYAWNFQVFAF